MPIIVLGMALAVGALVGLVVRWRSRVFARRTLAAMHALATHRRMPARASEGLLPPPVARYRELGIAGHPPIRSLLVRHGGTFCMSVGGDASPIRGVQIFSSGPPGFVWVGRVRLAPGVWIDARDELVEGRGRMHVLLDDTIAIANATGPKIDQGSALRLLAEMVWFPTALFDPRLVTWAPVDGANARATLRLAGVEVSATFTFGIDGFPTAVRAERYEGEVLRGWGGAYRDYRSVDGLKLPFEADVHWDRDGTIFTYARWRVDSFEIDRPLPAAARLDALLAPSA